MTGSKKPAHERYVIFRYEEEGCLRYETASSSGQVMQLSRSYAEHEVCSGAARYVDGRAA